MADEINWGQVLVGVALGGVAGYMYATHKAAAAPPAQQPVQPLPPGPPTPVFPPPVPNPTVPTVGGEATVSAAAVPQVAALVPGGIGGVVVSVQSAAPGTITGPVLGYLSPTGQAIALPAAPVPIPPVTIPVTAITAMNPAGTFAAQLQTTGPHTAGLVGHYGHYRYPYPYAYR